ncbi:lactonase family protein [Nocardia miyunensis]|uniref:lactonase family protein n=1 Tax=Nocardia miyunensis TaxID=282684 RepID=UPI00082B8189|nr:lactonase family protein [Nocardia miyunensis]
MTTPPARLCAFVGCYTEGPGEGPGGIDVFDVSADGKHLTHLSHAAEPAQAGYLVYAPASSVLYAVDERKTDGRGPVGRPAAVHALAVDRHTANLTPLNSRITPGPRPTYLSLEASRNILVSANHGDFDHVERVVPATDGGWAVEYLYDDSTVVVYTLREDDGAIGDISDVAVFRSGGPDPNSSPQAGGHAQASGHAHCAVIDPTGRFLIVCDKSTDRISVFELGATLTAVSTYQLPPQTGPRHLAFDPRSDRAYLTAEFSSELISLRFDPSEGSFTVLDRKPTTAPDYVGPNEPAEVRVHPNGQFVYLNNRGEDSLAWFRVDAAGGLTRAGHTPLSRSIHPGLAARSFAFDPTGSFLLVADRPADLVRSYAVDETTGALEHLGDTAVADPAFVEFAELNA